MGGEGSSVPVAFNWGTEPNSVRRGTTGVATVLFLNRADSQQPTRLDVGPDWQTTPLPGGWPMFTAYSAS